MNIKLAVVGATGLVGKEILNVLKIRNFEYDELILVASERSVGKIVKYKNTSYTVVSIDEAIKLKPHIAIFSAGGSISLEHAPKFAAVGTTVIDNSSAWRMDSKKALIVPEVNGNILTKNDKIIANPNCSTIQMVVPLKPLHDRYGIRSIVVSTYQSVTGSGKMAVDQLMDERAGKIAKMVYPHRIDFNALPHIDTFTENGYTKEEMKMTNETKKILQDESINLAATCVRIPTIGGHSEALSVELEKDYEMADVKGMLAEMPGCVLQDNPNENIYPMPINAHNKDEIFIGRLRRDISRPNSLMMWIVSDNLRKGAATNAVQIAELVIKNDLIED